MTTTVRLTVAQALVRFLTAQYTERDGVRHRLIAGTWGIFGHGNVAGIGQALLQAGHDVMPYYQGRNEQAMVHASVGYARMNNRLSTMACTTSIGPGATNLVTGAALATVNRVPVLLLPGDVFATRPADPVLQQLEVPWAYDVSVNDTLRPVSRYFDRIWRPEMLAPSLLQAMRVLTDPVDTGAVTLALPQDVQAEAYDWPQELFGTRIWHVRRPLPDTSALREAAALLRSAERPLIVAGGGVIYSGATDALRDFAAATGFPVTETQAGKGSLRHDHPRALGGIGHTGTAPANAAAREADVVLGIGTRWTDFTTASNSLFAQPDVRFVNLNITSFDAHKMAGTALVADARSGIEALAAALAGHHVDLSRHDQGVADWRRATDAVLHPDAGDGRPSRLPSQTEVLGALEDVLHDRDVVINAAGSLPGDLHKFWRARDPKQYHVEYGYSCMGYEIPAAIGVKLAAPDREVFALVGDGTYLMLPTEIVTAVQEGININLVIVQNHGYASIGGLSESVGAERYGTAYRFRAPDGTFTGDPLPIDLAANAASLGLDVLTASSVKELREALATARASARATAVYVETEPAAALPATPDRAVGAWWDVAVAEVSDRPSTRRARAEYEEAKRAQRRHL
ncbi:3D-(3,5/4)-trihydroxycyclohexane-1,2-dione acylhydrolase (decyclizing) [Streptomyces sp. H10-C2]|uniref:3D-(3,5/4)-trihydroxycyclohexane-1,2-dione acylhydrolase (decyclizing) n=1 Tax=unclassified Streptomyces TaxID=2593676 RepID=UPI0024B97E05|nr:MULTISPECIES: 3D-(3,5/4)-trihydroxycyclohexane-1,2-dione acylhydrolase (decyclizing) [unclassified Streptomyces]MDJ0340802.1 3D-(3,5/4)-trihydroxycyclohexane-1,2-dione acylhydrolase (decyclizing) [Streptomyces sp. PH10-H1]MDJ0371642.1 3D-(3,5/4)-trihydroxycyclohexane-1,2-dione acylhydrolase (decyclizing) [Streptomyces sp. H10-C2]